MAEFVLGIDTSNYTSSVAIVSRDGEIVFDGRKLLEVKEGTRGLRQQEAFFQHVNNLPDLIEEALKNIAPHSINLVSVSDRPRPIRDSYMPCFTAGVNIGRIIASFVGCDIKYFSHQEGHLEAARRFTALDEREKYIGLHFSGGTTEALLVEDNKIEIVGGTKDISFGQLIDRVGVKLGFPFPSGTIVDDMAVKVCDDISSGHLSTDGFYMFSKTRVNSPYINLSGLETQVMRFIDDSMDFRDVEILCYVLMNEISDVIVRMIDLLKQEYKKDILLVGGVSSSRFIRNKFESAGIQGVHFGPPALCSDNAVGIALLGGRSL